MPKLVLRSGRTGWYLRVREEGSVERGDTLTLMDRPFPRWTVDAVNSVAAGKRYFGANIPRGLIKEYGEDIDPPH